MLFCFYHVDKGADMVEEYTIRPLEEKDLRMVLAWRNSDRVHSKMLTEHKISWQEHWNWFQRAQANPVKRNLIFEYQGRPVGYIGYTEYDEENMSCSPSAYLGETDVQIDAGIYLLYMTVEYAFETLGMRRLESSIFKSNKQSMGINKFLGYREIPGTEKTYYKNGKEEVAIRVEMLREEWLENKRQRG